MVLAEILGRYFYNTIYGIIEILMNNRIILGFSKKLEL